ncbi:MAG: HDIG domain-containing protein [Deltaproteobacteria bacterium]|nr:HDIG domain-containing protein [Deltaproteobacteria bacterium]
MGKEFAVSEEEKKNLDRHLPLISTINNQELRNKVYGLLARALRESPYRDICEVPNFTTKLMGGPDDETFVRHTRTVTNAVVAFAREFQSAYGFNIDYDVLLAGAILHDIDKLLLYKRKGKIVELTATGGKKIHGQYGARMAEDAGFPEAVVNIITSHSPTAGAVPPASIEAVIVGCCDAGVFQCYRLMTGRGLWRKSESLGPGNFR